MEWCIILARPFSYFLANSNILLFMQSTVYEIVTVVTQVQHVGCGAARRYLCYTGTLTFSFLKWLNSLVHSSILDFIYLSCTYLRCITLWFDTHNAVKLINMYHLIVIIYYCVMSTTKSYSLGVFSVFNTVLLCSVIMTVHQTSRFIHPT